jgi:polar amino acid transport system permease protein
MAWNWEIVWTVATSPLIPAAMWTTIWVAVIAQTAGTLIGIGVAPLSLSKLRAPRAIAFLYSWLFRGTPLLVQILFFYAVLPQLGVRIGLITTGLMALALNEGARMAEIVRAGLMSVAHGQIEAARSLGLKPPHVFFLVTLPQAIRVIVPPLGNNFNYMLKATSLLSVIGFAELLRTSQQLAQATSRPLEVYAVAAICYLIITTSWDILQGVIEARAQLPGQERTGLARRAGRAIGDWARRGSLALAEAPAASAEPAAAEAIRIEKQFPGRIALAGVDLSVRPGEVVVVIGPSGCGKTTLLRCLNGLEQPDRGFVRVAGSLLGWRASGARLSPSAPRDLDRQRREIGMVFQRFNLFAHLTALENLMLAPRQVLGLTGDEAERRARALLDRVGLAEHADAYPAHLSGGQQQRVAIARALAMGPKLMLFDEPTSALDPETIKEVLDVMRALARDGMTMVVVTHEMGFARQVADRIVFMDEGKIADQAPATRFFSEPRQPRTRAFIEKIL